MNDAEKIVGKWTKHDYGNDEWPEFHFHAQDGTVIEAYTAKPSYRCKKRFLVRCWAKDSASHIPDFEADTLDEAMKIATRKIARKTKKPRGRR